MQKSNISVTRYVLYAVTLCHILVITIGCAPKAIETIQVEKGSPMQFFPQSDLESRSTDYVVLFPKGGESYDSLAQKYLGDRSLGYLIAEFNNQAQLKPGKEVVIPVSDSNPGGIYPDGYQTVPVLCYHRFSLHRSSDKITVSEETFDKQMAYLKNNGYNIITLKQLNEFIEFRRKPPKNSLVITIDDAVKAVKTIAYPILKKYAFTAVIFVNTDNTKIKQNSVFLNWDELKELKNSGVFEIESHTASHSDLTTMNDEQLQRELGDSKRILAEKLGINSRFVAYPYGLFNNNVLEVMKRYDYKLGLTVIRGANGAFNHPYALNRSMIYNSEKIEDFAKTLSTYQREKQ
ncbi:MAG: polysaccharide deacetylase family protein [Desulfuromonadaceae bacterium]|nr:polysaccharide deacetylase family protein [Desulfuromonadaceae bacterium]